jgi:hypothetical protein
MDQSDKGLLPHPCPFAPRYQMKTTASRAPWLLLAAALSGCLSEAPKPAPAMTSVSTDVPRTLLGPFVPIYRNESTPKPLLAGKAEDAPTKEDFYLAISKKELGQRWFLSSYLTQSTFGLFARSLGTSVVSFKVQNDKLFIFLAEEGTATSEALKPELVLEAYPLVKGDKSFESVSNAGDYVLFDPAGGLNRFTVLGENPLPVDVTVVFSQNFRKLADGATFEQVWSGNVTAAKGVTKVAGTLSFGLRRYAEGEGFKALPLPEQDFYFPGAPHLVKDEGRFAAYARKWNLREGQTITWAISGVAEKVRKEPRLQEFDFTSAIKAGIESWNQVFGRKVLEARAATEGEEYGQDDVNFFVFDTDKAAGGAFADTRHNPNSGEIRGASVYFPLGLIDDYIPPAMSVAGTPPPANGYGIELAPVRVSEEGTVVKPLPLAWGNRMTATTCDVGISSLDRVVAAATTEGPTLGLSRKEYVERFVAALAAHEIGHTLGLRHNFKGSLKSPSTSVMDYLPLRDMVALGPTPGSYDVAAINYLYGKSPNPPAEAFCTDEQVPLDPECRDWDSGATPLSTHYIPRYSKVAAAFLTGVLPPAYAVFVDDIVPHVRLAADPAARAAAYDAAFAPLRLPVGMSVRADARDYLTRQVMARLFLLPLEARIPPSDASVLLPKRPSDPVLSAAVADLKAFLIDADGSRAMVIRRDCADLLKKFQHASAAAALMEARTAIAAKAAMLTGNAAIETNDLLGRIDRYVAAYFD